MILPKNTKTYAEQSVPEFPFGRPGPRNLYLLPRRVSALVRCSVFECSCKPIHVHRTHTLYTFLFLEVVTFIQNVNYDDNPWKSCFQDLAPLIWIRRQNPWASITDRMCTSRNESLVKYVSYATVCLSTVTFPFRVPASNNSRKNNRNTCFSCTSRLGRATQTTFETRGWIM